VANRATRGQARRRAAQRPTCGRADEGTPGAISARAQVRVGRIVGAMQGKAPSDLVFAGPDGGYLPRPKAPRGSFDDAVKRSAVQKITLHDLRHTCASLAVSAGVNVLALQRMLGHKSAKATIGVYAALFDDDLDAVAETLHARYAQVTVTHRSYSQVAAKMRPRSGQHDCQQTQNCYLTEQTHLEQWRWRRDLNPRTGLPVTRFRGVLLRPLGHATAGQLTQSRPAHPNR